MWRNRQIERKVNLIMSSFADLVAALTSVANDVTTIKADVEGLIAKLAAVPPAGLTPEQQAALDAATAQAATIATSLEAISAEVPKT
jgi:hypothetical protein